MQIVTNVVYRFIQVKRTVRLRWTSILTSIRLVLLYAPTAIVAYMELCQVIDSLKPASELELPIRVIVRSFRVLDPFAIIADVLREVVWLAHVIPFAEPMLDTVFIVAFVLFLAFFFVKSDAIAFSKVFLSFDDTDVTKAIDIRREQFALVIQSLEVVFVLLFGKNDLAYTIMLP